LIRPSLLSRHLALASQTNSLTSFLALANPNTYNSQIAHFNESLTSEALQRNKFSSSGDADDGLTQSKTNDILFFGSKDEPDKTASSSKLIKVQYTDERNPLRRLAPHPFFPLESEKAQMILPPLLLPRPNDDVLGEEEKRWKEWADVNGVSGRTTDSEHHWIESVREQIKEHDAFAGQAIRSFIHAKEATDELGQRYDWKMRLDVDLSDEEAEEDELDDLSEEAGDKKRKREDAVDEKALTLEQVQSFLHTGEL
jgi:hypothetical protein